MDSREFNRKTDGNYAFLLGRLLGGIATVVVIAGAIWLGQTELGFETKSRIVFAAVPILLWMVIISQLYYSRSKVASRVLIVVGAVFTAFCLVGLGTTF